MSTMISASNLYTLQPKNSLPQFGMNKKNISASQIAEGALYTLILGTGLQYLGGDTIHGWSEGIQLAMAEATKEFLGEPASNSASLAVTKGFIEGPLGCLGPSVGGKGIAAVRRGETFDWKGTVKKCGVIGSAAHVLGMGGIADSLAEYGPKGAMDYLGTKANRLAQEGFVKPINYWFSAASSCNHTPAVLNGVLHNTFTCQLDNIYDLGRKAADKVKQGRQEAAFKKLDPDTQAKVLVLDTVLKSTEPSLFKDEKSNHVSQDIEVKDPERIDLQVADKLVLHKKTRRSKKKNLSVPLQA